MHNPAVIKQAGYFCHIKPGAALKGAAPGFIVFGRLAYLVPADEVLAPAAWIFSMVKTSAPPELTRALTS